MAEHCPVGIRLPPSSRWRRFWWRFWRRLDWWFFRKVLRRPLSRWNWTCRYEGPEGEELMGLTSDGWEGPERGPGPRIYCSLGALEKLRETYADPT
jgi:hypothetical protein